jgi:colicin import membrane protein
MNSICLRPRLFALLAVGLLAAESPALAQRPTGQTESRPAQQDEAAREREAARQREQAAAREREAAAANARAESARAEAARTQAARSEAARTAEARQGADRSRPALSPRERDQVIDQMITAERKHRELQGRMTRLAALFRQQGNVRQLEELEALRAKSEKRYRAAFAGFKDKLGPETYARVESAIQQKAGRAG